MLSTVVGGIIAVILALVTYKKNNDNNFYIGQKVYYYVNDYNKRCAGRITAKILCHREEDITINESRRIIPDAARQIVTSQWLLLEIQPIIGGRKLMIPANHILEKVGE